MRLIYEMKMKDVMPRSIIHPGDFGICINSLRGERCRANFRMSDVDKLTGHSIREEDALKIKEFIKSMK